ncbi:p-loop containing nucleoside triphosphate hydrolase protein [Mycena chlorophos]|uniref:p-loop containing nucleoside triphosphate hydrolase protein n=1 Tax=Mycena chlorophos TaxID=658473 RepID=A0A8H6WJ41_MYCCL|nr:p-loop containing nucleoside triphosphate hydrolase protein [Mycena chlorophos]
MTDSQSFLPVSGRDNKSTEESPSDSPSSFTFHGMQIWYEARKSTNSAGSTFASLRKLREHWPRARQLFCKIFNDNPRVVAHYMLSVLLLAMAPTLSICASFGLLIIIERGFQTGAEFEDLARSIQIYGALWVLMTWVDVYAKHRRPLVELDLQSHLRGLWADLVRKSLSLDLDNFTKYAANQQCALPAEYSFGWEVPCEGFIRDMVNVPVEILMLGVQVLALIAVCAIRGFEQSRVLIFFAIMQPLVIWCSPTNITQGQGFAFQNTNSSFDRVAQLAELANSSGARRTLMKDNACDALGAKYAAASVKLGQGNVPPAQFAYFLAAWISWPWSFLRGFILDNPVVLCVFALSWSEPVSSLVTMIILQQTTQLLRTLRTPQTTGSLNRLITSMAWAKTGYYDVLEQSSAIPSGNEIYPPISASSAGMKVEFRNVSLIHGPHFRDEIKPPAVRDLSFTIPAGALVVVVGSNGSGKSSLSGLLTRIWGSSEGQILIDDEPIERFNLAHLRDAIAAVEQDEDLYPGVSLRESVLLGLQFRDQAEESKILDEAARMSCAAGIIDGLPSGWDTIIYPASLQCSSEGQSLSPPSWTVLDMVQRDLPQKFSGGEVQRLTAARMFARLLVLRQRARLIVWDEATSKIDPWAEREIVSSLLDQRKGRTVVIATHDYQLNKAADLILVLKEGQLVEPQQSRLNSHTSYAYGAPTFGAKSPPKPRSEQRSDTSQQSLDPEKWSVKDTSVNIASAFHQAATDMSTPNNAWASGQTRTTVPRSTSVEYEQSQSSTSARRLAAPPSRLNGSNPAARKPLTKNGSIRNVPDSEEEEEPVNTNTRGKSPFEQVLGAAKRAIIAPAVYYVRQRSQEPDEPVSVNHSYEYTAEERDIQNQSKRAAAAHKRGRISIDNKAYRPSNSDLEDEDEDFTDDDGKKKRRKKKKKESGGGPLTSLPVAGYDKRKKKAKKSKGNADEMDEGSDSDSHATERQSASRASIPPARRVWTRYQKSMKKFYKQHDANDRGRVPADPHNPPRSPGAVFGTLTYAIFTVFLLFGRTLGTAAEILLLRPVRSTVRKSVLVPFFKFVVFGIFIFLASLIIPQLDVRLPWGRSTVFQPPDVPAANIAEIGDRLRRMETALSGLSLDSERMKAKVEEESRLQSEMAGKFSALETRVERETARALEAEVASRDAASAGLKNMKKEVDSLQALVQSLQQQSQQTQQGQSPAAGGALGSDEEARARLKALEERFGGVEASVREAIDLGKKNAAPGSNVGANWWSKSASKSGVTIKSSDGQDVTHVIADLVSKAVGLSGRDMRTDFAMHSSGAFVVPSLTTATYEVRPLTLTSKVLGYVTGNGYQIGAPPVVALHHDIHDGRCWPFAGSQGQLGVVLAAPVYIDDITIDHVSAETAINMRTSAPRDMEVWALVEGKDNLAKLKAWRDAKAQKVANGEDVEEEPKRPNSVPKKTSAWEYIRIATFRYDILSPNNIQTFPVDPEIKALGIDFGVTILRVRNNWGMGAFTCLYRYRVHGQKVNVPANPYPPELLAA